MAKPLTALTTALGALALGGAALSQSAPPITNRDVVGQWRLLVMPAERDDLNISFRAKDGGEQLDLPLTITERSNGRLACVVRNDPANCQIRDGRLVVASAGGGVRMTYTLADRSGGGFSGTVNLRVRLLPIGGHIGTVVMTRR